MLISKCHLMGPFRAMGSLMAPPKSMGPRVIIPPALPPLGGPALQYTLVCTAHLLSQYIQVFLVLLQAVTGLALSCARSRLPVPY